MVNSVEEIRRKRPSVCAQCGWDAVRDGRNIFRCVNGHCFNCGKRTDKMASSAS